MAALEVSFLRAESYTKTVNIDTVHHARERNHDPAVSLQLYILGNSEALAGNPLRNDEGYKYATLITSIYHAA